MSELQPRACVLNASGINCDDETAVAFEMAGADVEQVHISQLRSGERRLNNFQILALPGGFSYGDDVASGKILALEIETQLADEINQFVADEGVVVGICNGFQALVKSGLLPGGRIGDKQTVTLTDNESGSFECRWTRLSVEKSISPFFDAKGAAINLPVANGEGRFMTDTPETLQRLREAGQIVLCYCDEDGVPTEQFPANPSGSIGAVAGICDESGLIIGMMPHPERFVRPTQHPHFRRDPSLQPDGLPIFQAMVRHAAEA